MLSEYYSEATVKSLFQFGSVSYLYLEKIVLQVIVIIMIMIIIILFLFFNVPNQHTHIQTKDLDSFIIFGSIWSVSWKPSFSYDCC